jgi:hypothetical protein
MSFTEDPKSLEGPMGAEDLRTMSAEDLRPMSAEDLKSLEGPRFTDCATCNLCCQIVGKKGRKSEGCLTQPYFAPWKGLRGQPFDIVQIARPRRKSGWNEETHGRIISKHRVTKRNGRKYAPLCHSEKKGGGRTVDLPFSRAKRSVPKVEDLITPSPRITTAITLGPNVLARPYFPNVFEAPPIRLSEERAIEATKCKQVEQLAGAAKMNAGGNQITIDDIKAIAKLLEDYD